MCRDVFHIHLNIFYHIILYDFSQHSLEYVKCTIFLIKNLNDDNDDIVQIDKVTRKKTTEFYIHTHTHTHTNYVIQGYVLNLYREHMVECL